MMMKMTTMGLTVLKLMGNRPRGREQHVKARGGRCEHTREGQTLDKRNILRIRWGVKTEGYIHLGKCNILSRHE